MNFQPRQPRLISVKRAAWMLGTRKRAVWKLILAGELRAALIENKYRVNYDDVVAFVHDAEGKTSGERLEDILRDAKGDK